jgi:hypothetical protein
MRIGLTLIVTLLATSAAQAVEISTIPTQIGYVHAYPNYGNGDVIFSVANPISGCSGFWLPPSDPGFKQTYGMLIAAKSAQASVMVWADPNQLWPGSPTGQFCRLTVLRLE